jgi:endo-1,4-beta-xylanase
MKQLHIITLSVAALLMSSCTDNTLHDIFVDEPATLAQYDYLKDYDVLKTYVDRTANPNFKLGSAVTVADYNQKGIYYCITNNNFDEMTAGNAMKHSSVVAKDGSMNFSSVSNFIDNAEAAGMSVFGHTLCWHSQQNTTYLNSLLADKPAPSTGTADNKVLHIQTTKENANVWDAQLDYNLAVPLQTGKTYTLTMRIKSSAATTLEFWPNDGVAYPNTKTMYLSGFASTKEWQVLSSTIQPKDFAINQLVFSFGKFAGDVYIDDVTLTADDSETNLIDDKGFDKGVLGNWAKPSWHDYVLEVATLADKASATIPLTAQEKKDTLTWAMTNWVKGMMEACNGKVKAWDVVNEPMSDTDPTALKSAAVDGGAGTFYWQDYLGKDYVRTVVALARQYGPKDEKLFINDYNLEAAYNNNAKCDGLINMIKYWESDGVTKIDGIATQMHVSYCTDAATQAKQEACVVTMFKKLAATGKLIKMSELDMGMTKLVDNKEVAMKTSEVNTLELKQKMSDYYKFIIKAYFDNIPAAQRYGITQWTQTDVPENASYRPGEPLGLWDANYYRKPAYAGFADGLKGK